MSLRIELVPGKHHALRRGVCLLGGSALALALAACSSSERDRYYSSRAVIIPAQSGDGSTTLAAWPYGQSAQPAATARANSAFDIAP